MQNIGEKQVQAHDEFLIDDEATFHNYRQFMRNEFKRTVSTLCEAIHTQDGESDILKEEQVHSTGETKPYSKKADDFYPENYNKQMLRGRKIKWPLVQGIALTNGASY